MNLIWYTLSHNYPAATIQETLMSMTKRILTTLTSPRMEKLFTLFL